MGYIRNHWQGNHSLFRSFWVNLVALRLLILFFERFTHPPFTEQSGLAIALTALYVVVFQVIVYGWQAMGVVKACDRYLTAFGSYITVLATQFGLVASLFVTLIYAGGAVQSLFADPEAMIINQRPKRPPLLDPYTLTVTEDGTRILVDGDFRIGIAKELSALLDQHPGVKAVVFSSNGGRVTEGRGLARVIGEHGLNTYVFDSCTSACTTAFIGGVKRILGEGGKLGFHQFRLDSAYNNPYIDPVAEQKIDLAFYLRQKIDSQFLEKVFQAAPTDIWFPSPDELLAAGVIDEIEPRQRVQ